MNCGKKLLDLHHISSVYARNIYFLIKLKYNFLITFVTFLNDMLFFYSDTTDWPQGAEFAQETSVWGAPSLGFIYTSADVKL